MFSLKISGDGTDPEEDVEAGGDEDNGAAGGADHEAALDQRAVFTPVRPAEHCHTTLHTLPTAAGASDTHLLIIPNHQPTN